MLNPASHEYLYAFAISLIKEGNYTRAISILDERKKTGNCPYIYSLLGTCYNSLKNYDQALKHFLIAYAQTRVPYYLRQVEDVLPYIYRDTTPQVLNSVDFLSFFKKRMAKISKVDFAPSERISPWMCGECVDALPSALYEEIAADRGLYITEDKHLELIFLRKTHSVLTSDDMFLVETLTESPSSIAGGFYKKIMRMPGTIDIFSPYSNIFTVVADKNRLPVHTIEEECIYIGGSHNTGHFLLDFLPKLELFARNDPRRNLPVYSYHLHGIFREMAETLFPEFEFKDPSSGLPDETLVRFQHVHIPSYVPAGYSFPVLRERARQKGLMESGGGKGKIVYLARGKEFQRLLNEDMLVPELEKIGCSFVDTSQATFAEIVAVMANAEIIITTIGSQESNIVFCKPGTLIIGLFPDTYLDNISWHFNDRLYTHAQIYHKTIRCHDAIDQHIGYKTNWLYNCNVSEVIDTVKQCIVDRSQIQQHELRDLLLKTVAQNFDSNANVGHTFPNKNITKG